MAKFFHIPCKIERGAFSGERTFTIESPGGGEPLIGAACYEYFLDAARNPIPDEVPPEAQVINGYVKCRIVRHLDNTTVE